MQKKCSTTKQLRPHYSSYFSVACLSFLFLFIIGPAHAQRENVWVFGNQAGVDFNGGTPTPITSAIIDATAANASVCDEQGNLLFYTEGSFVWDRNHNLMPNGHDLTPYPLIGGIKSPTSSTTQGALIVPPINKPNLYYIFSLTSTIDLNEHMGELFYSIVDMDLNAGLGDVVAGQKGIFVADTLTESMSAVAGNDCNIWLLTASDASRTGGSGQIKAWEINAQGISDTPVVSDINLETFFLGSIAVSNDRSKVAVSSAYGLSLLDFDPNTGICSNEQQLVTNDWIYNMCFSPDDTKLYCSYGVVTADPADLCQFDLSAGSLAAIIASKTTILVNNPNRMTHLKLAPDGKIYLAGSRSPQSPTSFLSAITQPNLPGLACNPQADVISLAPGYMSMGLPNVVPEIKRDTITTSTEYISCKNIKCNATDTSGWSYLWNDGATSYTRTIDTIGKYWISYITPCKVHIDTFIINKADLSPVIRVDKFELSTTMAYDTYQWIKDEVAIPGATDSTYTVKANGKYRVAVTNEKWCSDTSDVYLINNYNSGIANHGSLSDQIQVFPNPAKDKISIQSPVPVNVRLTDITGRTIQTVENAQVLSLKGLESGVYLLEIGNQEGVPINTVKLIKE